MDSSSSILLTQVEHLFEVSRYAEALEVLKRLLAEGPESHEALFWLAWVRFKLGEREAAVDAGRRLLAVSPEDPYAMRTLAEMLMGSPNSESEGIKAEALVLAKQAAALAAEDGAVWDTLAHALGNSGHLQEAWQAAQQQLTLCPEDPDAHFRLGWLAMKNNDSDSAIDHYQNALHLDPQHLYSLINCAYELNEKTRYAEAMDYCLAAARIDPNEPLIHSALQEAVLAHTGSTTWGCQGALFTFVLGYGGLLTALRESGFAWWQAIVGVLVPGFCWAVWYLLDHKLVKKAVLPMESELFEKLPPAVQRFLKTRFTVHQTPTRTLQVLLKDAAIVLLIVVGFALALALPSKFRK